MAISSSSKLITLSNLSEFKSKYTSTYIGEIKKDGAIQTVKDYVDQEVAAGGSGSIVTMEEASTGLADGVLKAYTFYQGVLEGDTDEQKAAKKVGTINLAKDLVVTAGSVQAVEADTIVTKAATDPDGVAGSGDETAAEYLAAGTYLVLTIANQTAPVYINVKDLVDLYTSGSAATDEVVVTVDTSTNKITASITDGTVTKAQLVTALSDEITAATDNIGVQSKAETSEGAGDAVAATGIYKRIEDLEAADSALTEATNAEVDALF